MTQEPSFLNNLTMQSNCETRTFGRDITNMQQTMMDQYRKIQKQQSMYLDKEGGNKKLNQTQQFCNQNNYLQPKRNTRKSISRGCYQRQRYGQPFLEQTNNENLPNNENNEMQIEPNITQKRPQNLAVINLYEKQPIVASQKSLQEVELYQNEIFLYLRAQEGQFKINAEYMKAQTDLSEQMRSILFDWLIDVHRKFRLLQETLYLTFNIIDRFLSKRTVEKKELQLVGVAALFIASKYEEIYAPELNNFVVMTDNAFTKDQILKMEGDMILELDFKFTFTSCHRYLLIFHLNQVQPRFFEKFADLAELDQKQKFLCQYVMELSFLYQKMIKYQPSLLASGAIYLVNKLFRKSECWNEEIMQFSQYYEQQIKDCAKDLCIILQNADKTQLKAVKRKFGDNKYFGISNIQIERVQKN